MDAAKGAPRTWMSECTGASVIIIVTMKHLDKLMHRNLNLKKQYLQKRAPRNGPRETSPEKRAPRKRKNVNRKRRIRMIEVTRLNGTKILINPDLIEFVEETPDTVISFTTGRKIIVKESRQEMKNLVKLYRKDIFT